ncbi:zinc-binding dehydrogenase [Nocardia sp. NPDC050697]|uniref:zinc-binding dehydrogenase n=1 Tax=Nocardia sp. NPDC050697 TaxID=3155158 RepID=UPI0033DD9D9F
MGIPGPAVEYVTIPAEALAPAPRSVELAVAAALPATGLTAHQALFGHGGLEAGQRVLINGAGGSVGGFAVQLAAAVGARVTATASPRSRERVQRYGAHRVVDHTATPVTALNEQFDLVLTLVRNDRAEVARLVELLDDGGTFVSTTTPGPENPGRGVRVAQVYVLAMPGGCTSRSPSGSRSPNCPPCTPDSSAASCRGRSSRSPDATLREDKRVKANLSHRRRARHTERTARRRL